MSRSLYRWFNALISGPGTRHNATRRQHANRSTDLKLESLESRRLLTAWPGEGETAWPPNWDAPGVIEEVEAKWTTLETTLHQIKTAFPDNGNVTINTVNYTLNVPGTNTRRFTDFYYDMPNGIMAGDSHILRHRQRHNVTPAPNATYFNKTIADMLDDNWNDAFPDRRNVQYKTTPERFGAIWFREESGSTDLTAAQVTQTLNGDAIIANQADDPVVQANQDHPFPELKWLDESEPHIVDNLRVVDFRYRIEFESPANVQRFEVSLDKVQECTKDVGGNYTVCDTFFEAELEAIDRSQLWVERLFGLRDWFETNYPTLIASTESKGNIELGDHSFIVTDDGDQVFEDEDEDGNLDAGETKVRYFETTGAWSTNAGGHGGDNRSATHASNPGGTATWTFGNLTPGRYKVAVTWPAAGGNHTSAPYSVFDNTTLLKTTNVNQTLAPSTAGGGIVRGATTFQDIGDLYFIDSGSLVVKITIPASSGTVVADAVIIQHVDDAYSFANGDLNLNGTPFLDSFTLSVNGPRVTLNSRRIEAFANAVDKIVASGFDGNDTINLSAVNGTNFTLLSSANVTLQGGSGNDSLVGSQFGDTILGDAGIDTLEGGQGDDAIDGGTGSDKYMFQGSSSLGTDTLTEGSDSYAGGFDTIDLSGLIGTVGVTIDLSNASATPQDVYGTNLKLKLSSITGLENVIATAYDDVITANATNNSMTGGAGSDTYKFTGCCNLGSDLVVDSGGTADTLDFSGLTNAAYGGVWVNLGSTASQAVRSAPLATDWRLTLSSASAIEKAIGSSFNDNITGNSLNNTIQGGAGNDVIFGGDGDDLISGGDGADQSYGGNGNDTLWSGNGVPSGGPDTMSGDLGDDFLDGIGPQ